MVAFIWIAIGVAIVAMLPGGFARRIAAGLGGVAEDGGQAALERG
jgi:hypothetical protein